MGYPPIEKLLPKANFSIYKLVRMAATRATELADGAAKLIEISPDAKTATIALEEIQQAKIVLKEVADKFKPAPTAEKSAAQA
jgi:DNA-directed RNA polymerase omega subunit